MELLSKWALLRKFAAAGLVRHTRKARRVVFFAHGEALRARSAEITPEYLLLGILQVDESLAERVHISRSVREALVATAGARSHSESKEVSLSKEARLAVANAAEEREHLGHKHTGTEHLLLGIMRGRSRAAEVLKLHGVGLESVRDSIKGQTMAVEWDGGVMRRLAA